MNTINIQKDTTEYHSTWDIRKTARSGLEARRWREHLAQYSDRSSPVNYTRTLKFRLDTDINNDTYRALRKLYDVTDGVGNGSLFYYFAKIHLAGFRLFRSAREALAYMQQGIYKDDEWRTALAKCGIEEQACTPSKMIANIKTKPKTRGGEEPRYDQEAVSRRICSISKEGPLKTIIDSAAKEIHKKFAGWKELADGHRQALRIVDDSFKDHDIKVPLLHAINKGVSKDPTSWQVPIVFDKHLVVPTKKHESDYLLHQIYAKALKEIRLSGIGAGRQSGDIKNRITTANQNVLSWLFGTGLTYFQGTPLDEIMEQFNISAKYRPAIREVRRAAKKIIANPVWDEKHYGLYRSSVGGRIDSWISNYHSRITEIQDQVEVLPDLLRNYELPKDLKDERAHKIFRGMAYQYDAFNTVIQSLPKNIPKVEKAFDRLQGCNNKPPRRKHIARFEAFSEKYAEICSEIEKLDNYIELACKKPTAPDDLKWVKALGQWKKPAWAKPLSALNRFSGGSPDINKELKNGAKKFRKLYQSYREQLAALDQYVSSKSNTPLDSLIESEEKTWEAHGETQARRLILHRWARTAINGSEALLQATHGAFEALGIFKRKKDLNKCLINRLGAIYRSKYSRSRHQAYRLNEQVLCKLDPYDELVAFIDKFLNANPSKTAASWRDQIALEQLKASLLVRSVKTYPSSLLDLDALDKHSRIPPNLQTQFHDKTVSSGSAARLINLYFSELRSLVVLLFRTSHLVRLRFQLEKANEFYYVPKKGTWEVPDRYKQKGAPFNKLLEDYSQVEADGKLNSLKTLAKCADRDQEITLPLKKFLRQLPHDWCIDLKMKGQESETEGIRVLKGSFEKGAKSKNGKMIVDLKSMQHPARLKGPSSYKGVIEEALQNNQLALSEYTLLFEGLYKQTIKENRTGKLRPKAELVGVDSWVALPVKQTTKMDKEKSFSLANCCVAIDLGEVGIGYAVYDLKKGALGSDAKPIAHGAIRIRSLRNLMRRVHRHRKHIQPKQKFQQRYNTQLAQLRNNAIGDVCHVIDSLCAKFSAFPVLESSVRHLASGSRQLFLVYDRVLNIYVYSDTGAHKEVRKSHWGGADKWTHPWLESLTWDKNKNARGTRYKPLYLFPGVQVSPYGTSQMCSACGRNPIETTRSISKNTTFDVDSLGRVVIDKQIITLKTEINPDKAEAEKERKKSARLKTNPEMCHPHLAGGKLDHATLIKAIKNQIRRKPASTRSKDTTQSRYCCAYEDCQHMMHADESAAINIGRKWMVDYGIRRNKTL